MLIACLGDSSTHGGTLITTNSDGKLKVNGIPICLDGCSHDCPRLGHGVTTVSAIPVRVTHDGITVVVEGSVAECGAVITPPNRKVAIL